jgi:hypothetical protein
MGFAQPDHFFLTSHAVVVVECKLSQTPEGYEQLDLLYRPLLAALFSRPVVGVLACRSLKWRPRLLIESIREILDEVREDTFTWHQLR